MSREFDSNILSFFSQIDLTRDAGERKKLA